MTATYTEIAEQLENQTNDLLKDLLKMGINSASDFSADPEEMILFGRVMSCYSGGMKAMKEFAKRADELYFEVKHIRKQNEELQDTLMDIKKDLQRRYRDGIPSRKMKDLE